MNGRPIGGLLEGPDLWYEVLQCGSDEPTMTLFDNGMQESVGELPLTVADLAQLADAMGFRLEPKDGGFRVGAEVLFTDEGDDGIIGTITAVDDGFVLVKWGGRSNSLQYLREELRIVDGNALRAARIEANGSECGGCGRTKSGADCKACA